MTDEPGQEMFMAATDDMHIVHTLKWGEGEWVDTDGDYHGAVFLVVLTSANKPDVRASISARLMAQALIEGVGQFFHSANLAYMVKLMMSVRLMNMCMEMVDQEDIPG